MATGRNTTLHSSHRILVVMVGLPARGKSFIAQTINRYLNDLHITCQIFNCGAYRRIATQNGTVGQASANFFDPDNEIGAKIREECCIHAMHDIISWYNRGGQISILDATNTTLKRRQLIRQFFTYKQAELHYNISLLYIESISNDQAIIHNNIISEKLKNADYCMVDAQRAIQDFKQRIKMYKKKYVEVAKHEGSYIKIINVGNKVIGHQINDDISYKILYFLMDLYPLQKKSKQPLLIQLNDKSKTKIAYIDDGLNIFIFFAVFIFFMGHIDVLTFSHFISLFL